MPWEAHEALLEVLGGPEHAAWRYDPIIPTVHTVERFAALAARVRALGVRRAVINFLAAPGRYARVDRRLAPLLPGWADGMPGYDHAWQVSVARDLVPIADGQGLRVACCAESAALAGEVEGSILRPAATMTGLCACLAATLGVSPEAAERAAAAHATLTWVPMASGRTATAARTAMRADGPAYYRLELVRAERGAIMGEPSATFPPAWYIAQDVYRVLPLKSPSAGMVCRVRSGHVAPCEDLQPRSVAASAPRFAPGDRP
jgi:hypothetical protein